MICREYSWICYRFHGHGNKRMGQKNARNFLNSFKNCHKTCKTNDRINIKPKMNIGFKCGKIVIKVFLTFSNQVMSSY